MEWLAAVGAVVGGAIGIVATLLADQLQWRRARGTEREQNLRDMYAEFLTALTKTSGMLRAAVLAHSGPANTLDAAVTGIFRESGIYEVRYRLSLVAPVRIARAGEATFAALRHARDELRAGHGLCSPEYEEKWQIYRARMHELRDLMRVELGVPPLGDGEFEA
ncbi:MAG: hypothetical protein HOQ05_10040 [Corynebacteriales bacterium]|nr:hypothetical protein [Mycobacteriales bacterium]